MTDEMILKVSYKSERTARRGGKKTEKLERNTEAGSRNENKGEESGFRPDSLPLTSAYEFHGGAKQTESALWYRRKLKKEAQQSSSSQPENRFLSALWRQKASLFPEVNVKSSAFDLLLVDARDAAVSLAKDSQAVGILGFWSIVLLLL